jgi:ureidoglycolate lyase
MKRVLDIEPLTREGFADFGDVVEEQGAERFPINQGFAERFNNLASVDVSDGGGHTNISFIVARPRPRPIQLSLMERHPLGSQIFYPLQDSPWLVAVCKDPFDEASYRAFRANGRQGVNYAKNVWHHPLLVLDDASRFLVVDRKGPGNNLEEADLAGRLPICLTM